jgi:hypothetical protein
LASQSNINPNYDSIPIDIRTTLDDMAFGIAQKENLDTMDVKNRFIKNVNSLTSQRAEFLVGSMAILIKKSLDDGEQITEENTQKEFISFLISLYY